MGMNIAGIAINKKYHNKSELESDLSVTLVLKENTTMEEAVGVCILDEKSIYVYTSTEGTLILMDADFLSREYSISGGNIFMFIAAEVSMSHFYIYLENRIMKRYVAAENLIIQQQEGNQYDWEKDTSVDEVIFNMIGTMIGESFWDIEPDAEVIRYEILNKPTEDLIQVEKRSEDILETKSEKDNKPWWKIFS